MVFESIVTDALILYLGDYVKNLSAEQLKISVFSGNVVLNNLELKGEALHALNLPFHVQKGFIGKLRLLVPWQNLRSQPVIVEIDQIYALSVPQSSFKYDEHEEVKKQQRDKQKKLNQYELMRQYKEKPANDKDGFMSSLVTKVVDNIQIKINQIHIRYEDKKKNENFALGVCISKLSAYSVDAKGNQCFVDSSPTATIHKVVKMEDFSIYLDSHVTPTRDTVTNDQLAEILTSGIATKKNNCPHSFIIKPVSAEVKLTMFKGMKFENIPKTIANCVFEEIAFCVEEKQYQVLLKVLSYINNYAQEMKYLKWRPAVRPSVDPSAWWRYAGTVIRKGIRKKWEERSWTHILDALKKRKEYVSLFKRTQPLADWLPPLNATEKKRLENLEEILPFEKIVFFRNIARAEITKEIPIAKQKKAALKEKKGSLFGFVSSFVNDAPKFEVQLTPAEMDEIYSIIDYNAVTADVQQPKDFVRLETNFEIAAVSLSVFGASSQNPLVHGILSAISFKFEQRVQGYKALVNLGKFTVTDYFTPQTQFPQIIRTVLGSEWKKGTDEIADGEKLFSLALEGQPLNNASDYSLRVVSHPLEVVANIPLLERLRTLFTPEENINLGGFSSVADKFNTVKEMTNLQLMDVLHHHKTVDLSMDIKAPVLIMPENPSQQDTTLAFFDLGNFTIKSDLSKSAKQEPGEFKEEDMYDRYKLSLSSIKALLTRNDLNWRDTTVQSKMNMHLVKEFDINLYVQKCIEQKELSLTQLKISGRLPKLEADLSDKKLVMALKMVDSLIPKPTPNLLVVPSEPPKGEIGELLAEPSSTQIEKDIKDLEDELDKSALGDEPQYSEVHKKELAKYVQFEGKFDVQSIVVNLRKEDSEHGGVLARLHMSNLALSLQKRTYDTTTSFILSRFDIEDCITTDPVCKYFVTSSDSGNDSSNLISISSVTVEKESPFYQNVDSEVNFKFHHLTIHYSPPSVTFLYHFFLNSFAATLNSTKSLSSSDTPVHAHNKPAANVPKKNDSTVQLKVHASVGSIQLIVNYNKEPAADFSITNIRTNLIISGASTKFQGQLGSVKLLDQRSHVDRNSPSSTIIAPLDSSLPMIDFEFISLNHPQMIKERGWDNSATLIIRKMKFVLVVDFALSLKHYLLSPFSAEKTSLMPAMPTNIALPPTTTKLKLDVKMESPQVLIPTKTKGDFIIADFGNLMIANQFVDRDGQEYNNYNLVLSDMHISRENTASSVLRDIEIRVNVEQPLTKSVEVPLKVTIDVPQIKVVLSDKEYLFLYGVLDDTLHSLDSFKPPPDSQSLLLPLSPPPTHVPPQTQAAVPAPPAPPAPPKTSTVTVQALVRVHSAVLLIQQNDKPLAELSIDSFVISFEDGGKEGNEELTMRLAVSIQNIQLVDKRVGKASPHYQYIVAPKHRDLTMLKFDFYEYLAGSEWGSSVVVDMKSVQLVVMLGFLFTVIDFVTAPFEDKPAAVEPNSPVLADSPHAPSAPPLPAQPTKSSRTKIQVQIDSPQILIPGPDDASPDHIVADLGDFSMHNSFAISTRNPDKGVEVESLVCALSKMHMRDIRGGIETDILHDVHLDLVIVTEKPILMVSVNVEKLEFEISDEQWKFLYATIWKTIDSMDDQGTKQSPLSPTPERQAIMSPTLNKPVKKREEKDDIQVNVRIGSAVLVTTTNGEKLGQFSIHNILVDVYMEDSTDAMRVNGAIGNILLLDVRTTAAPLYKTILSSKDTSKEMILFQYESLGHRPYDKTQPLSKADTEMGEWHSSFIMQFRQVEMVAMVGFILQVKDLVLIPIFARLDLEAARDQAERIKTSTPAKLSKIKLKVEIESPVVLLPSSPTQKDMLIAELGHFSLANHYIVRTDEDYSHVVTGEIQNMNMKSTRGGIVEQAMNDVQISIGIDFPSLPTHHQKFTVGIPKLEFSLSDAGWHFLYRIILVLIANMATPTVPTEPTFVDVKVGVVSLVLTQELDNRKQIPFGSASINNISVGASMKSNSFMKIDGSVGSLRLIDDRETPNAKHLYRDVLIPQDRNVNTIDFSYHEVYENNVADTVINIYMRKVKLVALWDYILQLKEIIWAPFEYKVTGGEAVVAPPPKEDLDGAKLKVEIESPLLILPATISTEDNMSAELGHFLLTNKFERRKHIGDKLENYNINVFSMSLNNTNFKTVRNKQTFPILHDLGITVGLELPVSSAAYASFPQMKIMVNIPRLDLRLDDVEYHFIYSVIMQTSALLTSAGEQTAKYKAKLAVMQEALPPTPLSPESTARKHFFANTKLPPDAVSMLVETNIDVIALDLSAQNNPLVGFYITKFNLGYTTRVNGSTTLNTSLGGILLEDTRTAQANSPHKAILQPKVYDEAKMLDITYETYAPVDPDTSARSLRNSMEIDFTRDGYEPIGDEVAKAGEWDSSLYVNMRSVKIVTMYGFLMAVKDFVLAPMGAPTQTAVSTDSASQPTDTKSRTMLMLEIESPQILIPASTDSTDMVIAELGHIVISNEIVGAANIGCDMNVISVNITRMNITSVRNNIAYPFLNDVLLSVSIQEPLKHVPNVPKQKYIIDIKPIDLTLTEEDYRFYVAVFSGNFLNYTPATTAPSTPSMHHTIAKEGVIETEMVLSIQSLGLLLKKEDGRSPLHSIASFQITMLRGAMRSYSSTSYAAELALGDITLLDARSNTTSEFKNLVQRKVSNKQQQKDAPVMTCKYRKERNQDFVEVMIIKLNVFFSPTAVIAIKDFFSSIFATPIASATAVAPATPSLPSTPATPATPSTPATPALASTQTISPKPTPISMTLVLHGLKLLFLEEEANPNSRAVIGKVFGKAVYVREENLSERYHLQASKLQLFVNNVNANSSTRQYIPIVNPCTVDIQYLVLPSEDSVMISTSNVDAYVSYKDVKLVTKILKNLNLYEEPNPNATLSASGSTVLSTSTSSSINNNNNNNNAVVPQKKQQLTVSSDMLKITFVNDLLGRYDLPFATVIAQNVAVHLENWSAEMFFKVNLEFEVLGFNAQTTDFEPVVDQTPLMIEYYTGTNPKKRVRISSKYLMNITISNELVGSVLTMYNALFAPPANDVALATNLSNILPPSPMVKHSLVLNKSFDSLPGSPMVKHSLVLNNSFDSLNSSDTPVKREDFDAYVKESGEVYQTGYYLYWIANYTGEPIEYYVEEGKYAEWNSAKASVVHSVESGQKIPLRLSRSLFKRRDFHQSGWSIHISVRIVGTSRYTSGISVNKIGEKFYDIAWKNTTAVIACEVDWQKSQQFASKLLTIRTPFYVTNSTSLPIYLALHSPVMEGHYTPPDPIDPGEKFYVPLNYSQPESRTSVNICPLMDELTVNWGEVPFPFDGFTPMHYFTCAMVDNTSHLPIRIIGKIETVKSTSRRSTEIVLLPPLTIENLLVHDIHLLFYNTNKVSLPVPSGESRELYTYDASKNLTVRIAGIPGFSDNQINTLVNANASPPRPVQQFALIDTSDPSNTKNLMVEMAYKDDHGSQFISLSCPCWIINNTLVPLCYQPSTYSGDDNYAAGYDHKSHLLMYSHPDLKVKAPDSHWSIPFSVNSLGGGVLSMDCRSNPSQYQFKIAITDGEKQFQRTRMISIYSHFLLVNKSNQPINCAQFFGPSARSSVQTLQPNQSSPFHWYDRTKPQLICVTRDRYRWSTGFNPLEVGHFCLKILAADGSHEYFMRVDIKDTETSTTISFYDEDPTHAPYLIENNTNSAIKFYQKGYPQKKYVLIPSHRCPFTWDDFVGDRVLMVEFESVDLTLPFDINKIREFKPIKYQKGQHSLLVYPSIKPEGPSRVLRFDKTRKEKSTADVPEELQFELNLAGIGISLQNTKPARKELLYIYLQNILFIYTQQCSGQSLLLTIDDAQIDNQDLATNYPVLLMTIKSKEKPFIHVTIVKSYTDSDLDFYEYFGVNVQEMVIRVEDHILLNIMNFLTSLPLDKLSGPSTSSVQRKSFYKLFVLNPIKINLSFVLSCKGFLDSYNKYPVIRVFVRALSASLGVLEDAPLFFNALAINNLYTTNAELKELLKQHYQSQAKNKAINLVGAANVLGNPVSLFNHISTGVVDFFFEPALGIMKSPKDFGKGLKKGTTSLIKRSIYGTSNSSAKFFGAVSQGVAQWSVDPEYLKDREIDSRKKAKNVGEGLVLGAQGLGKGFFHGVTGLLTKPIEGAIKDGAGGFAKGVAQGIVGVAVKPVSGLLDFASRTSEGVSANVKLYKERKRVRDPKQFPPPSE